MVHWNGFWKEVAVAQSRYCPGICLVELRRTKKTSVRIDGLTDEIRTEILLNTSQDR
jgi:hypothetical protein